VQLDLKDLRFCRTAVRAGSRRSARLLAPDSEHTTPVLRDCTGYASRSESSSGCVFWHSIVCMAQHRYIWHPGRQPAADRQVVARRRLRFVELITPRRWCWCHQPIGELYVATAQAWKHAFAITQYQSRRRLLRHSGGTPSKSHSFRQSCRWLKYGADRQ